MTLGLAAKMQLNIVRFVRQALLEFKIVQPLNTVHRFLERYGGLRLLDDPQIGLVG